METRLKPCPFCGGEPYEKAYDRLIIIGCERCGYRRSWHGLVQTEINTGVAASYCNGKVFEWYDKDADVKACADWNKRAKIEEVY